MEPLEQRTAAGKELRKRVPRSSHGEFSRDPALDPVDLLLSQEQGRIPSLVPVRRERMAESAFAFYRAGALLMATDLASTPRTGPIERKGALSHAFSSHGHEARDSPLLL